MIVWFAVLTILLVLAYSILMMDVFGSNLEGASKIVIWLSSTGGLIYSIVKLFS